MSPKTPTPTLDDIGAHNARALRAMFERAERPEEVSVLNGALSGRLITFTGPLGDGAAHALTQRLAGSRRFPWQGKTFQSWSPARGSGVNRVHLLKERFWFRFETRIAPSTLDGDPCVRLDYDHADNPWPIRQVADELREIAPGLWLGPATFRGVVLLFFALTSATSPQVSL